MDRVHYRKYSPSRLHTKQERWDSREEAPKVKSSAFVERLIVQGIISGIIFAVVLALSIVDNPRVGDIRASLGYAVSSHISMEQAALEIDRFLGGSTEEYIHSPEVVPVMPQAPTTRIDEEILLEILGYPEGDSLQTTAPGPIILPEL